ncbi:PDDEXK nuclease domain-containing protein [Dysgonomonas sp. Marseille-P4361]|uniref:PDDEXK nuclease domain-containing protein n=1 Tax=Dysgonomonas sp. Marseille-P4361 TaxID=2161820 RepID=UPI001615E463
MAYEINNTQKEFKEIYSIISFHRSRAYQAVNTEIILTNWEIGKYVSNKIRNSDWGTGVVNKLVEYLKEQQPDLKGYNRRTIYRMVQFYETYSSPEFVSIGLTQMDVAKNNQSIIMSNELTQFEKDGEILKLLVLINWSSHLEILSGCKLDEERIFYILLAYNEKLYVKELRRQIDSGVYERSLLGETKQSPKLKESYPLANQLFKDSYMVDFLNLPDVHSEKSLQQGLVEQMKKFILDLGRDFIFMGNEYRLQVGMTDYKVDLLFYHRGLQCLVAMELKTTKFKPEYMGQLDFYLEALDRDVRKENENPSIGILLCKSTNSEAVEYSLSRSLSPTMVAEYKQKLIPKEVLRKHLREYYEGMINTLEEE